MVPERQAGIGRSRGHDWTSHRPHSIATRSWCAWRWRFAWLGHRPASSTGCWD